MTARDWMLARAIDLSRKLRAVVRQLGSGARIADEDVRWAYRLLLDREPESDRVVAEKLAALGSRRELRTTILLSPEFRTANPQISGFTEHCVVLKELAPGVRIFLDLKDVVVCQAIAKGDYERDESALVRRLVAPGQSVVDVGANVGYYALLLASLVGRSGSVHAFEPFPAHADLLERSIAENHLHDVVHLPRTALGSERTTLRLVYAVDTVNAGGAYLAPIGHPVPPSHAALDVAVARLDEQDVRRPVSFIKLDAEGAEPFVLEGARDILERDRPTILSELHRGQLARVAATTPRDLIVSMRALGYACHRVAAGRVGIPTDDPQAEVTSVVFLHRAPRPAP